MTPRQVVSEVVVTVEVPKTAVEVVEELTSEEATDRHQLELRVEKAFYQAGTALRELRDRRLYRSTHKTFEEYCRTRFDFTRMNASYLIAGASVVDNLLNLSTNRLQILPTKLEQTKPLARLKPDQQRQVWQEAVEAAGGKVPSGRVVKGIVERLLERNATPSPISYTKGDVVEIRAGSNSTLRKHNGCWGIVTHVGIFSCKVHISVRNVNVQCKPDEMDPVDPKYTTDIRAVHQRITALMQRDDLSRTAIAVVETLVRQTCFSPGDLWLLEKIEEWHRL